MNAGTGSPPRGGSHDPRPLAAGDRLGRFRLEGVLGRGGMGIVWRAVADDGALAAVKVLRTDLDGREGIERRFAREARVRVDHPNVVRVLDAGVIDDGTAWIAFELLEGETLEKRLSRGRLDVASALDIAKKVSAGVAAAHRDGIVHRDIKPANIHLGAGDEPKVLDFGVARFLSSETRVTAHGMVVGTPSYLSPEQARGQGEVDARSDVWSLGVVLYQMLSGRSPFERDTPLATMLAVLMDRPPPLASVAPNVPTALAEIVDKSVQKRPGDRFADAGALLHALETIDEGASRSGDAVRVEHTIPSLAPVVQSITPGEQRVVAVLLADGVQDLRVIARAVESRGGVLLPLAGGRAIGLFGGESWEGDEVDRAAAAALESRGAAAAMAVSSGRASYSGTTGIAGSALLAAENACAARLAGVGMDSATARALSSSGQYRLTEVAEGLYEMVARVSAVPMSIIPPGTHVPTLGREAELAQMRVGIRTAIEQERASAMLVVGPPGVGKSRLRGEMQRMIPDLAPDAAVLTGRAEPLHRQVAFSLMRTVLEERARARGDIGGGARFGPRATAEERAELLRVLVVESMGEGAAAREVAGFLGELLDVPMPETPALAAARRDPSLMGDRLRLALLDWLRGLSEVGPIALLLEDLHWADAASLDLLEELMAQLSDVPFVLFATARPELLEARPAFLAERGVVRIEPRGLMTADVAQLAAAILGRDLSPDGARALAERTAGNPLFVEQIAFAIRDEGRAIDDTELPLPLTVEAAVQSRLDHLPAEEKDLCKRGAVFERAFTAEELEALGVFEPGRLLASLARRDVIGARGRPSAGGAREYRFRSRLVRDVAYRMVADPLREELHRRAAALLASRPDTDPEETASHFERARLPQRAAEWYARAALAATRRADSRTVLRCTDRALALGAPSELVFELHCARSDALESLGRLEEQRVELDRALETAADDAQRARAQADRAVWLFRAGGSDEAVRTAEAAVESARRSRSAEMLAMARGRQGAILVYLGRLDEARAALDEAERIALSSAPNVQPLVAVWRAQLATAVGDLGERRDAYRVALALYTTAGDLRRAAGAELNLADVLNRVGAYGEAENALRDALDKSRRVGSQHAEAYSLLNLGYALAMQERREEALAVLSDAALLAEQVGESRLLIFVGLYRGRALESASPADAVREATAAAAEAEELGLKAQAAIALAVAARAHLAMGDVDRALETSRRALEIRDALGGIEEDEIELFLARARALAAAGHEADAREVRERARRRLGELAGIIGDARMRERFVRDVPAHRELGGA